MLLSFYVHQSWTAARADQDIADVKVRKCALKLRNLFSRRDVMGSDERIEHGSKRMMDE